MAFSMAAKRYDASGNGRGYQDGAEVGTQSSFKGLILLNSQSLRPAEQVRVGQAV